MSDWSSPMLSRPPLRGLRVFLRGTSRTGSPALHLQQAAGASPQRCLWASTSMKSPDRRDVTYVEELIGPNTVTTMPRATVEAFLDHGKVDDTLTRDVDEARRVFERFAEAGIDYDDITAVLERERVDAFVAWFDELFEGIAGKRAELVQS
ncbi:transaldolase family protein [Actinoplanes sp. NPDC020271]|uniref:transaldolase family protein n=1 Tax=Actinoplanes sp. NPDC020271 TaxID=3363896 RepID=UPI00379CAC19